MLELIKSDTFWSAVSALATLASAAAIVFAARQLRFEAWLKAQEIWGSDDFIVERGKVFARLQDLRQPWTPEEMVVGLKVCRKIDEFVRLAPYFGERRMLAVWGDPLAKAWVVLEPLVVMSGIGLPGKPSGMPSRGSERRLSALNSTSKRYNKKRTRRLTPAFSRRPQASAADATC